MIPDAEAPNQILPSSLQLDSGSVILDPPGEFPAKLYNLDAVAHESLMAGFSQVCRGPSNDRERTRAHRHDDGLYAHGATGLATLPRDGFDRDCCRPVTTDATAAPLTWAEGDMAALADRPVKFRFHLKRAGVCAFWVSRHTDGRSGGDLAAGGPGYARLVDD